MATTAGDIYVRSGASGSFTGAEYVQGGWITVASQSNMNSIYHDRISDGQVAYVRSSNRVYIATKFVAFQTPGYGGTSDSASWTDLVWPSASFASNGGGGGGITISNNANNRVLTGDGSNAVAETKLTFDGTTLTLGAATTASFKRLDAEVISSSLVQVDASTLQIGGTSINKTLVDNVKLSFSSTEVQTSENVTTEAATGSFSGYVTSSLFLLSSVQGAPPTAKAGGMMFSGSAFYLGFE
tara:strand:- start:101 stop:823 length:723 start_codon:yes stop_codon:yes gene_type:complete